MGNNLKLRRHWTFENVESNYGSHGFHVYPSRMMPKIASNLLEMYGDEGTIVLDPFCGSGGVLVECMLKQYPSIGFDINPLACLIAQVKTTPLDINLLNNEFNEIIKKYNKYMDDIRINEILTYLRNDVEDDSKLKFILNKLNELNFGVLNIEDVNILYWFKLKTILELILLKNIIDEVVDINIKNFFLIALSATIRNVSGTRGKEWKLYRMEKKKWETFNPDTYEHFNKKVLYNINKMRDFNLLFVDKKIVNPFIDGVDCRNINITLLNKILNNENTKKRVTLIITSPPYGDSKTTMAYGEFSRYSSIFLNFDLETIKTIDKLSLGGRLIVNDNPEKFKTRRLTIILNKIKEMDIRREEDVDKYFQDIFISINNLYNILAKDGKMCFIIGNRTVKGLKLPTDKIIIDICKKVGFKEPTIYYRDIPNKKMPFKIGINKGKIDTMTEETILIFQK